MILLVSSFEIKLIILLTLKGVYVYLEYSVTVMVRKSGRGMKLSNSIQFVSSVFYTSVHIFMAVTKTSGLMQVSILDRMGMLLAYVVLC
jgi:cytochrome b subunit of formate dehydrogenase